MTLINFRREEMDREIHLVPISLLSLHAGVSGVEWGVKIVKMVTCVECMQKGFNHIAQAPLFLFVFSLHELGNN